MTRLFLSMIVSTIILSPWLQGQDYRRPAITASILSDSSSIFYLDIQNYPVKNPRLPVGIFDSGTGGLAVLEVIVNLDRFDNLTHQFLEKGDGINDFNQEYFQFLADQANMPYGNYSRENNINLLKEHIFKDVQFLLGKNYYLQVTDSIYHSDKEPVKVILIACNTATATAKADIVKFLNEAALDIRVIGVIDAGVKAALDQFEPQENGSIAIMATAGTVATNGYPEAIKRIRANQRLSGNITIYQQAGIGLAGAIDGAIEFIDPIASLPRADYRGPTENHPEIPIDLTILSRYGFDWTDHKMLFEGSRDKPYHIQINSVENYIAYHVLTLVEQMKKSGHSEKLKNVILACTHYPFYREVFAEKFNRLYNYQEQEHYPYRLLLSPNISLIDPSENMGIELYHYLTAQQLFNDQILQKSEFFISLPDSLNPDVRLDDAGNFSYDYKYHRHAGVIQQYVKRVPMNSRTISAETQIRLKEKVPTVYELMTKFSQRLSKNQN
jgi:glutamate racemase